MGTNTDSVTSDQVTTKQLLDKITQLEAALQAIQMTVDASNLTDVEKWSVHRVIALATGNTPPKRPRPFEPSLPSGADPDLENELGDILDETYEVYETYE